MPHSRAPVDLILSRLAEDAEKAQGKIQKAPDVILGKLDTKIASTPFQTVYQEDRVKLKYYKSAKSRDMGENIALLVVYALINRDTVLDLQHGRSMLRGLLDRGIDIYLLDWGYPTRKDRFLDINDHVNGYIENAVNFILRQKKLPKINLMGICMGGVLSIVYSALHPDKVKNLITVVTPVDFDSDKSLLNIWMRDVDVDRLVNTFGNMPGDILNIGFILLNPARLLIDKYVGFLQNIDNKNFIENFIRMEKWIYDTPDVPGETFKQFVKDCYQKNLLVKNRMEVGGEGVNLKKITMPLLNIYGKHDNLVPPETASVLRDKVGSADSENFSLDTGHIGIFVSSKTQKELAPKIVSWLRKRNKSDNTQLNDSSVRRNSRTTGKGKK